MAKIAENLRGWVVGVAGWLGVAVFGLRWQPLGLLVRVSDRLSYVFVVRWSDRIGSSPISISASVIGC